MKKLRHWVLACGLLSHVLADTTTANEIVNERPLLKGTELEKHWRLDCPSTIAGILAPLSTARDGAEIHWDGQTMRNLELCAFIYNTPNTSRTQPCPNYGQALTELQNFQNKDRSESRTSIDHRLRQQLLDCN